MKRQARLFALVEHLRGRRTGVTAAELGERFGTTARTIYRDLETLKDAALPLVAERGRGGGYSLDRSYTLPPVNFTAREAAVLLTVGRWAREMRWMPFEEVLGAGLDKVRGALSISAQRDLIDHMGGLQFMGIPAHVSAPGVRAAVEQAWFERRSLRVTYRSGEGALKELLVRVEGVLLDRQHTYLQCESPAPQRTEPIPVQTERKASEGEGRRTLRLDRIERAMVVPLDTSAPPRSGS